MSNETNNVRTLPPDPDEMNDDRSHWAEQAIGAFELATGSDREDALADLLADLAHWCDRNGMQFQGELKRAIGMYDDETSGDGEQLTDITLRSF